MSLAPEQKALLQQLRLFNAEWYLATNEDVRASGADPWQHFLDYGLQEGRQPGPGFDPEQYLSANPDLRESDALPLAHYLRAGHREGRPLTPEERAFRQQSASRWPEAPVPDNLPDWYGARPGPAPDGVFRVLYVLSVQSGGTPQTNQDLMLALGNRADVQVECFVLRCTGPFMVLYLFSQGIYVALERHRLDQPLQAFPHSLDSYDQVARQWLADYGIQLVHVRHSAWQSLGLMDMASELDIPVVYSFHDYYAACPSVKLLDEHQRFCGGRCTYSRGECHQELWPDSEVLPLKHESIYRWQSQFAGALALCAGFVSTVSTVRDIMLDVFPALTDKSFAIIPHGRDFEALTDLAVPPEEGQPLRVLVPGHIARSKGADILLQLAAMPELQYVQWHILGTLMLDNLPGKHTDLPTNIIEHGEYQRAEFQGHVDRIRPHVGAVLSIWPETWCHTLTELWAAGLPVVGFDTGAVGERLKKTGAGWTAETITPRAMAQTVLQASKPEAWQQTHRNVMDWQKTGQRSCAQMAEDYWTLYKNIVREKQ
ncbi:MAG: glycosyltransferase [Pseudomonadota bacterium]